MISAGGSFCPKCGNPAKPRQEGLTSGLYCTRCSWSVVTTNMPEIRKDRTKYEVRLTNGVAHNVDHERAVASITGLNFLAARKLLEEQAPLVFTGLARDVVDVRHLPAKTGILYTISPDFRY